MGKKIEFTKEDLEGCYLDRYGCPVYKALVRLNYDVISVNVIDVIIKSGKDTVYIGVENDTGRSIHIEECQQKGEGYFILSKEIDSVKLLN